MCLFEPCPYSKHGNAQVFALIDARPFSKAACFDSFYQKTLSARKLKVRNSLKFLSLPDLSSQFSCFPRIKKTLLIVPRRNVKVLSSLVVYYGFLKTKFLKKNTAICKKVYFIKLSTEKFPIICQFLCFPDS